MSYASTPVSSAPSSPSICYASPASTESPLSSPALSVSSLPSLESVSDSSDDEHPPPTPSRHCYFAIISTPSITISVSVRDDRVIVECVKARQAAASFQWHNRVIEGEEEVARAIRCPDSRFLSIFYQSVQHASRLTRPHFSRVIFDNTSANVIRDRALQIQGGEDDGRV